MFDDQPASSGPLAPNNLPFKEPPDIFEATEAPSLATPFGAEAAAPINFAPTAGSPTSALDAGILRPKQDLPPVGSQVPPNSSQPPILTDMNSVKEPTLSHGIMITIMVVVVGFILVGSGWFVYHIFTKDSPESVPVNTVETPIIPPQITEEIPTVPVGVTPLEEETFVTSSSVVDQEILLGESLDTDGDGLKDNRETELGLDPLMSDSDMDGLSDGEELLIWRTNPKNSDTDGDTYKDGDEVDAGYSPSGPGRLAEIVPVTSLENNIIVNNTSTVDSSFSPPSSSPNQVFEIEL